MDITEYVCEKVVTPRGRIIHSQKENLVRCKYCNSWQSNDYVHGTCPKNGVRHTDADFFCRDGAKGNGQ